MAKSHVRFDTFYLGGTAPFRSPGQSANSKSKKKQPTNYNSQSLFPQLGAPQAVGYYDSYREPSTRVERQGSSLRAVQAYARKAGQESVYARSGRSAYLVSPQGATKFTKVYYIITNELTSDMENFVRLTIPGGSLYTRGGFYVIEVGAYPGYEKETSFAVRKVANYFANKGVKVKIEST
jgi:hypothetical protein